MTDHHDALDASRRETRAAFENRALMYYYIFDELAEEIGRDRATEVMKRAIYRRGTEVAAKYREAVSEGDLARVGRLFCETSPCGGALFHPGVESVSDDTIVLRMDSCPLLDAWRSLGLEPDELDLMCEIAAAVDYGTFEGAGFDLTFASRLGQAGASRCVLELRAVGEGSSAG